MNLKDLIVFVYGTFMGTSTGYLKAPRSHFFPFECIEIDPDFSVQLGGTCNCGLLRINEEFYLINTSRGQAAIALRAVVEEKAAEGCKRWLVATSESDDDLGGVDYFRNFQRVKGDVSSSGGGEGIVLRDIGDTRVVFLNRRKTLFAGRLFYNGIHPPLKESGRSVSEWILWIEELLTMFEPDMIVPAEGLSSNAPGLRKFLAYLRDFSDPSIKLDDLRERYGQWDEIVGSTSLSENYEFARGIVVK